MVLLCGGWGFFAHKKINELAVYTLPVKMSVFYKSNIEYIREAAVNPDRRRYAVVDEAPRHFIDLDVYGDSAVYKLPRYWQDAVNKYGEDSLKKHGIVPWHIYRVYNQLKEAFLLKDPERILRLSADLGHYVADAHVPLHTTQNYDGQLTGQIGIHGFWESRLPELFFDDYDFFVGKAEYLANVQLAAWQILIQSHQAVDSVLSFERELAALHENNKYNFETKGKQTVKVFSESYSKHYHEKLDGMVERQFRASVKMTGNIWFTAWVDAGQPDLKSLINYKPSEEELAKRKQELLLWKERNITTREHESTENHPH
ncbi:MAG: zinc dependent phospholipase C family protein [Cyclobacteriaceae bacterium]|nr:zinc dependent phospholipase C family protein [Cyclobacteriaceae bacterium]